MNRAKMKKLLRLAREVQEKISEHEDYDPDLEVTGDASDLAQAAIALWLAPDDVEALAVLDDRGAMVSLRIGNTTQKISKETARIVIRELSEILGVGKGKKK